MSENNSRGKFVWYELLTSDVDAATSFYTDLMGWGTEVWGEGENPYTMWMNDGKSLGGVMVLPEEAKAMGAPNHWLAYVATPDVDATAAQASELGGKVLKEPFDIPEVGRIAILADPQGAVIAAFTPADDPPGDAGSPKVGEFSWHELATTDYDAAFDFYNKLFGWEKTDAMDMGGGAMYQRYGLGGPPLGGMFNKTPDMPGPPSWLYYAVVKDVDQSVEKVKELGGQILNGPLDVPGGSGDRVAQCMDPQGAAFAIHSASNAGG